jgi:hypothetical protein
MTKRDEQSKHDESELEDAQLENVMGGAGFLTGPIMAQHDVLAWVNTGNADGFIMKDSVIVKTSTR